MPNYFLTTLLVALLVSRRAPILSQLSHAVNSCMLFVGEAGRSRAKPSQQNPSLTLLF